MAQRTNLSKKKSAASPEAAECAFCSAREGHQGAALSKCTRCKVTSYCSKPCQLAHWRGGHKVQCVRPEERTPQAVCTDKLSTDDRKLGDEDECPICLELLLGRASACTLPCSHTFHRSCVEGLRSYGINQVCPMCRKELPPGPDQLFEEACRAFFPLQARVERGEASWGSLTAAQQREMDELIQKWRLAANQGHAVAQFSTGNMYHQGQGVPKNYKEALGWYMKASEQGNAEAQFNIGLMYLQGHGYPQNYKEALRWFMKAAEQGFAKAQYNIGIMYLQGQGVGQNYKEALRWFMKAAEQEDAHAQDNIGIIYHQGMGVPQNYKEALRWFMKAAEQGFAEAQSNIGNMYHQGMGVPRNYKEALRWYMKASEQGHADAQHNTGLMSLQGQGVPQNYKEALRWFMKAAEQGFAEAQFNIGIMYLQGEGVGQNYKEALRWFMKAAEQGDANAQFNIGALFMEDREGVQRDLRTALKWVRLAAAQGHPNGKMAVLDIEGQLKSAVEEFTKSPAPSRGDACASCGVSGKGVKLNSCSRCKAAKYCGRACQTEHWKVHKKICEAAK
jgi:TPR repeat protein